MAKESPDGELQLLDVEHLEPLLERIAGLSSGKVSFTAVDELLASLAAAPQLTIAEEENAPSWRATLFRADANSWVITCWKSDGASGSPEVVVQGAWHDGRLSTASLTRGEQAWATAPQAGEMARWTPAGFEQAREQEQLDSIEAAVQKGREAMAERLGKGSWTCSHCGAANSASSSTCSGCDTAAGAPAADGQGFRAMIGAASEPPEEARNSRQSTELQLPEDWANLLQEILDAVKDHTRDSTKQHVSAATEPTKCHKCGHELQRDARFCDQCGAKQNSGSDSAARRKPRRRTK